MGCNALHLCNGFVDGVSVAPVFARPSGGWILLFAAHSLFLARSQQFATSAPSYAAAAAEGLFDEQFESSLYSRSRRSFPTVLLCMHTPLISHSRNCARCTSSRVDNNGWGAFFTRSPHVHCACRSHLKRQKTPPVEAIRAAIVNFYISIDFSKHSWRPGEIMALKRAAEHPKIRTACCTLCISLTRTVLSHCFA